MRLDHIDPCELPELPTSQDLFAPEDRTGCPPSPGYLPAIVAAAAGWFWLCITLIIIWAVLQVPA